ncbi:sulfurtransferase-like selenium metabolism protein YedF [Thermodesulfovibrio thiophilus]|uniref:sulfurtransferase-like selenium metabolism protein YedF n=1 Tax=Thermodesulfovibrio thiophilus TaxID=340095 RepID=UPI00040B8633|nr:sulfurtransferase-like selenium metabolism protein YedF [Thermodesulfovibrio thiophilus]HHW20175.1 sulfurtransferase-like selenium metabolism protein YedF [Thermodesulfovibrio thiophilus]
MEIIDARGLECPKPIILAENALSRIQEGTLTIIVDNESAAANLQKYADRFSYYCEIKQEENYWKVTIVKGYTCQISTIEKQIKKNLLVIISSDTIGKDEALGRILMKSFFETIIVTGQIPQMIFLMNTAVKLSTVDEEFIPILKKIEEMGTEIFTCGTCLKYYNLENNLKVGFRGTTNHFVEGLFDFNKTVWIG